MRIDYNSCEYSVGADNPHSSCLHQNYCIFNHRRWELEKQITDLENQLLNVELVLSFIGDVFTTDSYSELKKEKTILTDDLERLKDFRAKIIDNEVREYGNEVLEFERT